MRASVSNTISTLWRLFAGVVLSAACVVVSTSSLAFDDRVALVIGNDNYPTEPLKNGVNDARAMQQALQELGFKVVFKQNADIQTMRAAAVQFAKQMDGASAAVFYYAGHGIQHSNRNFLVPVDAKLTAEQEIAYFTIDVDQILTSMEDAKVRHKFIILDACRNNPFRNLNLSNGLAKSTRVPAGTTISYAAGAGAVALDGEGENGLFTKHLVNEIRSPGVPGSGVFEKVGSAVSNESMGRQNPETQSTASPRGAFFFAERGALVANSSVTGGGVTSETAAQVDREYWTDIKASKKLADFQGYLKQFPSGIFADRARSRIDDLRAEQSQQQVAVVPLSNAGGTVAPVLVAEKTPEPAAKPTASPPIAIAAKTTPTEAPIRVAAAPASVPTSEVRGLEQKFSPPATPAPLPAPTPASPAASSLASTIPAATAAPPANQVAVLSPDQKSSLPLPPVFPKMLTGTLEFSGGARYVGDYKEDKDKNQVLHGKGEYISPTFRYNGEFRDGKKQGKGVYIWADGAKFDGEFANDQVSGKGRWEFSSGDVYVGDVLNAVMVGKGILVAKNGDKYDGLFSDGKPHGQGMYAFANGDRYEGGMVAGKMSGKGVYISKSGDKFMAPFVDGVANGQGTYEFSNGDRYVGEIKNGALTGKGKYSHSDGQSSEGTYVNGVLNGPGKFFYNNGSIFEGVFENGWKRAVGVMIQKDGNKRNAEVIDGVTTFPGG